MRGPPYLSRFGNMYDVRSELGNMRRPTPFTTELEKIRKVVNREPYTEVLPPPQQQIMRDNTVSTTNVSQGMLNLVLIVMVLFVLGMQVSQLVILMSASRNGSGQRVLLGAPPSS
jgi:hypothetical protein